MMTYFMLHTKLPLLPANLTYGTYDDILLRNINSGGYHNGNLEGVWLSQTPIYEIAHGKRYKDVI